MEYVSSAGLRTILDAVQYMEDHDYPPVKIHNVNESILETFGITGFDEILDIAAD